MNQAGEVAQCSERGARHIEQQRQGEFDTPNLLAAATLPDSNAS